MFEPDTCRRRFLCCAAAAALSLLIGSPFLSSPISAAPPETDGDSAISAARIVSFSPALTQMLIDLGLAGHIVGVGAYDPVAPEAAQVVGHLYHVDYEKLLSLRPTHVFYQRTKQPLPQRLADLAAGHDWQLHGYAIESIADVLHALGGIAEVPGVNRAERARQLAAEIEHDLQHLAKLTADHPRPRTLLIVGTNPITGVGPGTFLNEILEAAGGRNVLHDAAALYPVLDRERLLSLNPQVVVLIAPQPGRAAASGGGRERTIEEAKARLNLPQSLDARVVVIDDPTALLPSTTLTRIARQLAAQLHPLAPQLDSVDDPGRK